MKLETRELPTVVFRRTLPGYLAKADQAFIEFEARAGGAINPAYVRAMDAMQLRAQVLDAKRRDIKDAEAQVEARNRDMEEIGVLRFTALYDSCVIAWKTDILDDGVPMIANRANFIELCHIRAVPELTAALMEFEAECLKAGEIVKQAQDATVKN